MVDEAETLPETAPIAPQELELTVGGKTYKLGRVGFLAKLDAEKEIRELRRAEFRGLVQTLEGIESQSASRAISAGFDNYMRNVCVTNWESAEFFNSAGGTLFLLHRSLQVHLPAAALDDARAIFGQANAEQFEEVCQFLMASIKA